MRSDPPAEASTESPPGVLMVGNFLGDNGNNPGVGADLGRRLTASGWRVTTTSGQRQPFVRLLDMLWTAWSHRQDYAVALVEVYSGRAFVWAEATSRLFSWLGKPVILVLHGGNLPTLAERSPRRVSRLLTRATKVVTPSVYLRDRLQPLRADIVVIENPIDLDVYRFVDRRSPTATLVWLRAFHHTYDPLLAVDVLAELSRDQADARLVMYGPDKGDGSYQETREKANHYGLGDRLKMPGQIAKQDVPESLHAGDIFINTTRVDNTPISVLEAMACGLAVVSTNVGGIPSLLDHEVDALLVEPGDPPAMAAAIRRLLSEPGLASRLTVAARTKVGGFSWHSILPRWQHLLQSVVDNH